MARVLPVNITLPGFFGLNTRQSVQGTLQWAETATNCVIDTSGRLAARLGRKAVTASAVESGAVIKSIFEQIRNDDTLTMLSGVNDKIYKGTGTLTDITGTAAGVTGITDDHWQFQNIANRVVGFQAAHDPVVRTTANFSLLQQDITDWVQDTVTTVGDIVKATSGNETIYFHATTVAGDFKTHATTEPTWNTTVGGTTADDQVTWTTRAMPNGNICHSAFGRIWTTVDGDGTTVYFSDTLIPHKFSGGLAGTIDLDTVWGGDTITAISSIENFLVIFGRSNVLLYSGANDPSTMVLAEKIEGIGCLARDTVQITGNDIVFLSDSGVRALSRAIESGGRQALGDLSANVRTTMMQDLTFGTVASLKAVYDEFHGFYLISATDQTQTYVFDLRFPNSDGSAKITMWDQYGGTAFFAARDRKLYVGDAGILSEYSGYNMSTSGTYVMTYVSTWSDYGHLSREIPMIESRFKFPKRWVTNILTGTNYLVTWLWGFDYSSNLKSLDTRILTTATPAEWNVAEWNLGEWSGGDIFSKTRGHPTGHGVAIRIGWRVTIDGAPFAIQSMDFGINLGRIQ